MAADAAHYLILSWCKNLIRKFAILRQKCTNKTSPQKIYVIQKQSIFNIKNIIMSSPVNARDLLIFMSGMLP